MSRVLSMTYSKQSGVGVKDLSLQRAKQVSVQAWSVPLDPVELQQQQKLLFGNLTELSKGGSIC